MSWIFRFRPRSFRVFCSFRSVGAKSDAVVEGSHVFQILDMKAHLSLKGGDRDPTTLVSGSRARSRQ
jgi:hypothetical protein